MVCVPAAALRPAHARAVVENLRALGFLRVLADGRELHLDEPGIPAAGDAADLDPRRRAARGGRPPDPGPGRGRSAWRIPSAPHSPRAKARPWWFQRRRASLRFSERFRCPDHPGIEFLEPTPRLFSFNNPYGSCPECTGFGAVLEYDESLVVPNPRRSSKTAPSTRGRSRATTYRGRSWRFAVREGRLDGRALDRPPADFRHTVLHGRRGFQGVFPFLEDLEEKRYKQYIRVFLRQYQTARECPACGGAKLRPEALRVRVSGRSIAEVAALPLDRVREWVAALSGGAEETADRPARPLSAAERDVASTILRELVSRLEFLCEVGLGYLTLDRQTRTLSGGEAQRISLANALGSRLVDALYVLDEPTIGLHPADNDRLLRLLVRLREHGNTVLMVEHDPAAMRVADHLVELGPGSGELGGSLMFQGTLAELEAADTLTGRYLSGREEIAVPARRRPVDSGRLRLEGAREHNLRGDTVIIPLGVVTVVTGVSGSGKSTLVHDVLYRAVERELSGGDTSAKRHLGEMVGAFDRLTGASLLREVVLVDQSPIGRTPRSNPVTYIKAYDEVRRVFASLPDAARRGFGPGHFSFNVAGGRCEACRGEGQVQVEMVFMADVFVPCEACGGARFKPEVLQVRYRGRSIRDVLEMTVDEAIRFFLHEDRLGEVLWHLQQVGLGYLRLGQPAPTLSGGEAQRIKVARELAAGARRGGKKLYILDEPTTGLHADDVRKLLRVLGDLADSGHTVVLIEHNLDVVKTADWIVDLGPGAGPDGGHVVAMGRPEDVAAVEESVTGRWLAPLLSGAVQAA
jgi:excinuclease ABC subunit A